VKSCAWLASHLRRAAIVLVAVSMTACGRHETPSVVLAEQCERVQGELPLLVRVQPPAAGELLVRVVPKGISVLVDIDHERARSQVDRFGVIAFVRTARANEPFVVGVFSRDSPEIAGEACVTVTRLPDSDPARLRAERAFAAAGHHLQSGDPKRAFDDYLAAARDFDDFDRVRAAEARHAMAELAYGKISRETDAYWLARVALADFGAAAAPGLRSSLFSLQARTLLESDRFEPNERHDRVFRLLTEAQRLAGQDPFGARELPRLDILRGFMEYRAGNPANASAYFSKAASQCEALHDWECYARALQNSASLAEEARDFTVALKAYADALRVLPPHLDPQLTADIWGNQGRLQGTAGLVEQSEQSHRQSIRLHANIGDCEGARVGTARLGSLLVQVGSVAEGGSLLARATSLECPALLAAADTDIEFVPALTVEACADLPKAETLGPSGKLAVFNALLGLREALRLDNRQAAANRCLAAARDFAVTARTAVRLTNAEGDALLEQRKPTAATTAFRDAVARADAAGLPENNEHRSATLLGLARASLQARQPQDARDYARKSLALGSARADVSQVVSSLQLVARSHSDAGDEGQAISVLRTAIALVDRVPIGDLDPDERATWLGTQHEVFAELTALFATKAAISDEDKWQAFDASERGRARSLRYAVNQATADNATPSAEASLRYRDLMQRIADLAKPATPGGPFQVSMQSLEELARSGAPPDDTPTDAALQSALAALDATAVEYATGRDEMYAFVVDSEHISVTRLGPRQEIASAAANLYERLRNPESAPADVQRSAAKLAKLVFWPIAERIKRDRIVFVPDDSLHTVPFAVLPSSADERAPLLIERAELAVAPSTLFITHGRAARSARAGSSRFELIGDPIFRAAERDRECADEVLEAQPSGLAAGSGTNIAAGVTRNLPRLPGSRQEVLAIAQIARKSAPSTRVSTHLGCEATPSALRSAAASSPDLLHIATHGYVDAFRPRLSALALTQDSAQDGGATSVGLLDILNMKVGARLVVLSACDTSRGRLLPGEGVLGPAQAFLQAGAASVVASYWRIPDEHTAPFMETFYRYLLVDRLSAAAALRRTQLDYARDRASHDWAAFTLYGWPDTAI
jgi:CHAT domain-containing protein